MPLVGVSQGAHDFTEPHIALSRDLFDRDLIKERHPLDSRRIEQIATVDPLHGSMRIGFSEEHSQIELRWQVQRNITHLNSRYLHLRVHSGQLDKKNLD